MLKIIAAVNKSVSLYIMKEVNVISYGIGVPEVINRIEVDPNLKAQHCQYLSVYLNPDTLNNSAGFTVNLESKFELAEDILLFKCATTHKFLFKNFIVNADQYELLKDCVFKSYKEHLLYLKTQPLSGYSEKLKYELEPFQYKDELKMALSNKNHVN